jgi:hypothetical protein
MVIFNHRPMTDGVQYVAITNYANLTSSKISIMESQGSPTNPSLTGDQLSGCRRHECLPAIRLWNA